MSVINPGDRLFHYDPNTKKITGMTRFDESRKNVNKVRL
jgi:hypothetical protein